MLKRASDEFGRTVSNYISAMCYELTDGGDKVRGNPDSWYALKQQVKVECAKYEETQYYSEDMIFRYVDHWLKINENKDDPWANKD